MWDFSLSLTEEHVAPTYIGLSTQLCIYRHPQTILNVCNNDTTSEVCKSRECDFDDLLKLGLL